ncbi:MAG TPA: histidine kinase dimerization/phospho-acceptor domain-containing protein, partial [Prolixibacteraceae bacterium]|nr:histidine kinase dimerization/phospho-acceptor domain-containing protein [Prolixibacteraceae bacterium]
MLTAIVLSVLLIGFTSYVSYKSIIELKNTINSIAEPNNIILSLQEIQKDLTAVQSYIRTYTYSHENQYLNKYKTAEKSLDMNLVVLGKIITDDYKTQYDSINIYINYKKNIIAYYVSLQTEDKNAQLDSITSRIDGIINETDSAKRAQNMQANENGFRKIINFIFSNKDKAAEGTVVLPNDSITALKRSIQDAKNIAEEQQELQESLEMELLDQDLMIMNEVSEFISDILKDENEKLTTTKEKSVENIQSTLLYLGAIIGLTLLFISYLLIKIILDIKRGERYRDKLEEAKRKAEDLTETKVRFMSNMSHEIRTPLTAIVGFSEQAKKQNITLEEKTKYLNIISKSSEYLLNIVNEILTFSKIEAGKEQLERHDFSLEEVLEEVYLLLKPKADDKNIELLLHTDAKAHNWYKCDSQKIKQILIN